MSDETERLARVETQVGALLDSQRRMEDALIRLADAVGNMAEMRLEHDRHGHEIEILRQENRQIRPILTGLEKDMEYAKSDIAAHKSDISRIKRAMPNLELMSGGMFKIVMAVLTLLALAAVGNLMKGNAMSYEPPRIERGANEPN